MFLIELDQIRNVVDWPSLDLCVAFLDIPWPWAFVINTLDLMKKTKCICYGKCWSGFEFVYFLFSFLNVEDSFADLDRGTTTSIVKQKSLFIMCPLRWHSERIIDINSTKRRVKRSYQEWNLDRWENNDSSMDYNDYRINLTPTPLAWSER